MKHQTSVIHIEWSVGYAILQLVQPRSAIILVTVVDGTVESARTAFILTHTVDGPVGGVGIGDGV